MPKNLMAAAAAFGTDPRRRLAPAADKPTRRPSSTVRVPDRLWLFISGTGWYQGERHPDDGIDLDRMKRLVDAGKVDRSDLEALAFLAKEADYLWSCSDDTYDPSSRADRAVARRFLAKLDSMGVTP